MSKHQRVLVEFSSRPQSKRQQSDLRKITSVSGPRAHGQA